MLEGQTVLPRRRGKALSSRAACKSKRLANKGSLGVSNKSFHCEVCEIHVNSETQLSQVTHTSLKGSVNLCHLPGVRQELCSKNVMFVYTKEKSLKENATPDHPPTSSTIYSQSRSIHSKREGALGLPQPATTCVQKNPNPYFYIISKNLSPLGF